MNKRYIICMMFTCIMMSTNSWAQLTCDSSTTCVTVFDDFAYDSAERYGVTADTSIFGDNEWCSNLSNPCTLVDEDSVWFWRNWDNPNTQDILDDHVEFPTNSQGRTYLSLIMDSDWETPQVMSAWSEKTGTWAARVKWGVISELAATSDNQIMAFWLTAPVTWGVGTLASVRTTELDIEYNNWFNGIVNRRINTANHGWNSAGSDGATPLKMMDCEFYSGSPPTDTLNTIETTYCHDYIVGGRDPGIYDDTWWDLMIVYDGTTAKYSMQADGYGGSGSWTGTVWGGGPGSPSTNTIWNQPVSLSQYTPQWPSEELTVNFSQHFNGSPATPTSRRMDVEWFYYSDRTDITIDDIQFEVSTKMRRSSNPIVRYRSSGFDLDEHGGSTTTFIASISGPSFISSSDITLKANQTPALFVGPRDYDWERRFVNYSNNRTGWTAVGDNPWEVVSSSVNCSLYKAEEYRVTISSLDTGNTVEDTSDIKTVTYSDCGSGGAKRDGTGDIPRSWKTNVSVYPNPANSVINLEITLEENKQVEVKVFDALGRLMVDPKSPYLNEGKNYIELDTSQLVPGTYFYVISIDDDSKVGSVVIDR